MSFRRTLITTAVAFAVAITLAGCGTTSGTASAPPQTVTATQAAPTAPPQTVTAAPVTVTVTATPKPAAPTSEAPSSSAVPTPAAGAAKLGEPVPYDSNRGSATATLHSAEWTTDGGILDIAPKNGAYLVLDVAITVQSGNPQGTNSLDWEAKDADGRVYMASMSGAPDPSLHATETAPGETTRGFLAFDMPKGTATVRLTSMVDGVLASWVVK